MKPDQELYLEKLKQSIHILSDILDTENYGMCIVDREGRIVLWNYERFFHIREEDVLGKPVTQVLENTRLHIVARTGKKELFQLQKIGGANVISNRIPIEYKGEIIGAAGTIIFRDTQELGRLYSEMEKAETSMQAYRNQIASLYRARSTFDDIKTENDKMISLKEFCRVIASSDASVLIRGESGTGKELFAQAIHNGSDAASYPFIGVDCAALPSDQLEEELFGRESDRYSGKEARIGKFELADRGTLFLDELGSLSPDMQARLLRVLETREYVRIGGNRKLKFNARVIAATNEDLEKAIEEKRFRRDLYYRLNVIPILLPPLRERIHDIPCLCRVLLPQPEHRHGRMALTVSDETIHVFEQYDWPGNVRELRNVLERASIICPGDEIGPEHLPDYFQRYSPPAGTAPGKGIYRSEIENLERRLITDALDEHNGNKAKAARSLGIARSLLYKKISELGIGDSPE